MAVLAKIRRKRPTKLLAPQTARVALSPSVAPAKEASATRRTSIGPVATRLAAKTTCGRTTVGSTRARRFGIATCFPRMAALAKIRRKRPTKLLAPQTARVALSLSAAPAKEAFATRRTSTGPAATRLAAKTTCGRTMVGSTRARRFGIATFSRKKQHASRFAGSLAGAGRYVAHLGASQFVQ